MSDPTYTLGTKNCWWCHGFGTGIDFGSYANGFGPIIQCPECNLRTVSQQDQRTYREQKFAETARWTRAQRYDDAMNSLHRKLVNHRWKPEQIEKMIAQGGPFHYRREAEAV